MLKPYMTVSQITSLSITADCTDLADIGALVPLVRFGKTPKDYELAARYGMVDGGRGEKLLPDTKLQLFWAVRAKVGT